MTEAPQALPGLAVVAQLKAAVDIAEVMPWETEADRPKLESWARQSLREACTIETIRSILALIAQQKRNFDAALVREGVLRDALDMLYAETADYIRLNNLGGLDNQCMRLARAALAPGAAGSTTKDTK